MLAKADTVLSFLCRDGCMLVHCKILPIVPHISENNRFVVVVGHILE